MSLRSSRDETDNPYGDRVLTDPRAMRALSHPVRLAVLSRLQRHGPATATELSEHVGASPSVTSWHLRHLATFDLVRDSSGGEADGRKRYWEATAPGFRFEFPEDAEGRAASEVLGRTLVQQATEQTTRWLVDTEPRLEPAWRRESGVANTTVTVTVDELAAITARIEEVLAPYVVRDASERPEGSRRVRLVRHTMPSEER